MASTTFVDGQTVIEADWLNDVNTAVYNPAAAIIPASSIVNTPAGTIVAVNVQAAINELDTEKQAANSRLTTLAGITAQQATDLSSVSTFIGTLLNDADAATARATLGAGTVTSVSGTAPVSVATGTSTPVISMEAATASVNGYMTSTYASKLDGIAAGANVGYPTDAGVNAIGMLVTAKNNVGTGAAVASGGTTSGAVLVDDVAPGTLPGTWRNVGASSVADTAVGRFQRIA